MAAPLCPLQTDLMLSTSVAHIQVSKTSKSWLLLCTIHPLLAIGLSKGRYMKKREARRLWREKSCIINVKWPGHGGPQPGCLRPGPRMYQYYPLKPPSAIISSQYGLLRLFYAGTKSTDIHFRTKTKNSGSHPALLRSFGFSYFHISAVLRMVPFLC